MNDLRAEDEESDVTIDNRSRRLPPWVGVLLLSILSSAVWEMLFRPGLSTAGKLMSELSKQYEKQIYSGAAHDPTSYPSLVAFTLIAMAPIIFAGNPLIGMVVEQRETRRKAEREKRISDRIKASVKRGDYSPAVHKSVLLNEIEQTKSQIRMLRAIGTSLVVVGIVITALTITVVSDTVKVWRITTANLDVAAAYLPDQKIRELRKDFRLIKSKEDFEKFKTEANALLEPSKISLDWSNL
jgi:hypothetical protein